MKNKYYENYPKDYKSNPSELLKEKREYERRLVDLLEDIRMAALGIDPQSKLQLRILEKQVKDKLREVLKEINEIVRDIKSHYKDHPDQGRLF
jgi:DNA phosphorothioation-dependent restriction protein DptG